jgi:probable HAF family extracellular repeat protein
MLATTSFTSAQQEYILVDLGTIDAGMGLPLSGLDNLGVRLNNITAQGLDPSYQLPAVQIKTMLDQQDLMTAVRIVDGQETPLGSLGGAETIVHDVNFYPINECRYLRLVGASQDVNSFFQAFIWDEVGGMSELEGLGGDESDARAINDVRQIVGWAQDAFGEVHATLWEGVVAPTDLNDLVGEIGPSLATDIDNYGHIVGQSEYSGFPQATAWVTGINGIVMPVNLGAIGGDESAALAVEVDQTADGVLPSQVIVAGWTEITPGGAREAATWELDTLTEIINPNCLGTLGGMNSVALDVTNIAEAVIPIMIVGTSDITPAASFKRLRNKLASAGGVATEHAFTWDATHGMRDLNDLIDPNAGWELVRANSLNSSGSITGAGLVNGEYRAFRLDPINPPQPCPADSDNDGMVGIEDFLKVLADWGACP